MGRLLLALAVPLAGEAQQGKTYRLRFLGAASALQYARYIEAMPQGLREPGDLPIRRATKLELVVNLKAAGDLGLRIPPSVLLRADQVIE